MKSYQRQLKAIFRWCGDGHYRTPPDEDLTDWENEDNPEFQKRLEELKEKYKDAFGNVRVQERYVEQFEENE